MLEEELQNEKIVSLVFSLLLVASLAATALAAESTSLSNFKQVNAYESGQFGDVKSIIAFAFITN